MQRLRFRYEGGSTPGRVREVTPFGVLFGRSNYLVAAEDEATGPRNWRLDRIHDIAVTDRPRRRPEDFSLQAYADESFGIYQDDTEDVVLRVTPAGRRGRAALALPCQPDGRAAARRRR